MQDALLDVSDDCWGIPTELIQAVKEELRYRKMQELDAAIQEQHLAATIGRERFCLQYGEQELMVHPVFYHYWGRRLGYECWQDKQFIHEFRRDNDICRVKNISRKTTIGTIGPGMRKYFKKADERAKKQVKTLTDSKGTVLAKVIPDAKPSLPMIGTAA
jgi:hypothetical protein